jgi:hypothetical protein
MRTLTDPVAVITELNSFFDTMDHNVEWIDFSALHDVLKVVQRDMMPIKMEIQVRLQLIKLIF